MPLMGRVFERLTIRTVLLAGFGLMLGLWLFAGYHVTQRVRQVQRNSAGLERAISRRRSCSRRYVPRCSRPRCC